jgi:hypothetical protein
LGFVGRVQACPPVAFINPCATVFRTQIPERERRRAGTANDVHNVGLVLAGLILGALLLSLLLRVFRSKHASTARLLASLFANVAVAIFTGREALAAISRGGPLFIGVGVALAVIALFAAMLVGVFTWGLARDWDGLQSDANDL